jgi:hypothetical protein
LNFSSLEKVFFDLSFNSIFVIRSANSATQEGLKSLMLVDQFLFQLSNWFRFTSLLNIASCNLKSIESKSSISY